MRWMYWAQRRLEVRAREHLQAWHCKATQGGIGSDSIDHGNGHELDRSFNIVVVIQSRDDFRVTSRLGLAATAGWMTKAPVRLHCATSGASCGAAGQGKGGRIADDSCPSCISSLLTRSP